MSGPSYHGWTHDPDGSDPIPGLTTGGGIGAERDLKIIRDDQTLTTGDGQLIWMVPTELNGLNLISAEAYVTTVSSSGLPTVQIRNITQAADMLSTKITIDVGEFNSYGATTHSVVDTANDDVATGDLIAIDVDVAGTGAKGLGVVLVFDSDPGGTGATGPTGATGATGAAGADGADGAPGPLSGLLSDAISTDESTTSTSYTNLATDGPKVTIPNTGDYLVMASCRAFHSSARVFMGVAVGNTNPTWFHEDRPNDALTISFAIVMSLTSGDVLKLRYKVASGTGFFSYRSLIATPLS